MSNGNTKTVELKTEQSSQNLGLGKTRSVIIKYCQFQNLKKPSVLFKKKFNSFKSTFNLY